ncbi:hypothetical protein BV25DRAFT_1793232 [Artomyces pyxidatus]|uniref:Uncharacterized protein n=1 Tax=Artomyces pyxidatus TaxID=48021 RepID=A0ACB8THR9_9AGAM|nr:hypothetical protein BV25DRAFT_1793232 [Artomyces pyxidatus]
MPQRPATSLPMTSNPAALSTAYSLSLLSEYTHTLDTLPMDLSRQFADLRELDAVLSASMHAIISKINRLVEMIEQNALPKEERLWLLAEIAEEAQRLKLGGEDKIRVASQAADGLRSQHEHMTRLLHHVPGFDKSVLARHTVYPHVAPRSYAPIMYESGRRRRGALLTSSADQPTPAKRKRGGRDDDADPAGGRTPRKERVVDGGAQRPKNGSRAKKVDRTGSPTESLLSITSHQPNQQPPPPHPNSRANPRTTGGNPKRRSRPTASTPTEPAPSKDFPAPPPSSHPSLPAYPAGLPPLAAGWSGPVHARLEGPGMPVARSVVPPPMALVGPGVDGGAAVAEPPEPAEGEGEADDGRTYCWCNMGSFGEMVACDDTECEREWFHLSCIGMNVIPDGAYYCDACKNKPKNKRAVLANSNGPRGGKRKSGGGMRAVRAGSSA